MRISNTCDLCGLEFSRPAAERRIRDAVHRFCCLGCLNVYVILVESGALAPGADPRQTELFRRSLELGLVSIADPRLGSPAPPKGEGGRDLHETTYQVSGMWCSSCAWLIERTLGGERGVISAEVAFASDLLKVCYDPRYVPPGRLEQRVARLGYGLSKFATQSGESEREQRDLLLRLGIAGFLWLNVMTFNLAIYVGYFESIPDSVRVYMPVVLMVLTAPAVFYCAAPVFRLAWRGLMHGAIRMEALLAAGILASWCYSAVEALRGGRHVYFDTACALVALVLCGKYIERTARERTKGVIASLYRLLPAKARLLVAGEERFVPIDKLQPGDVFVVKAGERLPADGSVIHGESETDESLLTGESRPVAKRAGSEVFCGSVNAGGVLEVRITRSGGGSTLAQIVRRVGNALSRRSEIERSVDRVSRIFGPAVVILSLATFAAWRLTGAAPAGQALANAISVLVIACPCALGIATPLAITAAIGAASSNGILIGDSRVLETLGKVSAVIFDKTGTATEGCLSLREADACCLSDLASLEAYSEHTLGAAVVRRARDLGLELKPAHDVAVVKGCGIRGVVNGRELFIGSRRLSPPVPEPLAARAVALERGGDTVSFFGWGGEVKGLLAFADRIRPEMPELVAALKRRAIRVLLVSGDAHETTRLVAEQIGADDFRAETLPDEKAEIVRMQQEQGLRVAMIGDGINDAPALAQADLGIALSSGTDLAMQASAVVLTGRTLQGVLAVFALSARAIRVIRQNLFWAFFYNSTGIALAAAGLLNPILAAGAMVLSSLTVILNSLRLNKV